MSDSTNNLNLVRDVYDAYRRRDSAAIFAAFSGEATIYQSELLPWGGRYHGNVEAMEFLYKLVAHLDSQVELDQLIPAGDRVVAVGRTRGTVKATGKPFDLAIAHVWSFHAGKVSGIEFFIDTPTMLAALQPE